MLQLQLINTRLQNKLTIKTNAVNTGSAGIWFGLYLANHQKRP